jgi:hypothetical protein
MRKSHKSCELDQRQRVNFLLLKLDALVELGLGNNSYDLDTYLFRCIVSENGRFFGRVPPKSQICVLV